MGRGAVGEQPNTDALRGSSESAHILERLHGAAAAIDQTAVVALRSGQAGNLCLAQHLDRSTADLPLAHSRADRPEGAFRRRELQPTAAYRVAVDTVLADEFEHEIGPGGDGRDQ